jgi:hypothetical protein
MHVHPLTGVEKDQQEEDQPNQASSARSGCYERGRRNNGDSDTQQRSRSESACQKNAMANSSKVSHSARRTALANDMEACGSQTRSSTLQRLLRLCWPQAIGLHGHSRARSGIDEQGEDLRIEEEAKGKTGEVRRHRRRQRG